jgi:hypothetical protein
MNWKAGCGRTACPVWVGGDGQEPFSIHIGGNARMHFREKFLKNYRETDW